MPEPELKSHGLAETTTDAPAQENAAQAWVIPISRQSQFAIAAYEFKEILQQPKLIKIPLAPEYCQNMLIWDEQSIPVIDLNLLLVGKKTEALTTLKIGVLAYQTAPKTPVQHCGIYLFSTPEKVAVNNGQACALPENSIWQPLVISSFEYDSNVIPIVRPQDFFTLNS